MNFIIIKSPIATKSGSINISFEVVGVNGANINIVDAYYGQTCSSSATVNCPGLPASDVNCTVTIPLNTNVVKVCLHSEDNAGGSQDYDFYVFKDELKFLNSTTWWTNKDLKHIFYNEIDSVPNDAVYKLKVCSYKINSPVSEISLNYKKYTDANFSNPEDPSCDEIKGFLGISSSLSEELTYNNCNTTECPSNDGNYLIYNKPYPSLLCLIGVYASKINDKNLYTLGYVCILNLEDKNKPYCEVCYKSQCSSNRLILEKTVDYNFEVRCSDISGISDINLEYNVFHLSSSKPFDNMFIKMNAPVKYDYLKDSNIRLIAKDRAGNLSDINVKVILKTVIPWVEVKIPENINVLDTFDIQVIVHDVNHIDDFKSRLYIDDTNFPFVYNNATKTFTISSIKAEDLGVGMHIFRYYIVGDVNFKGEYQFYIASGSSQLWTDKIIDIRIIKSNPLKIIIVPPVNPTNFLNDINKIILRNMRNNAHIELAKVGNNFESGDYKLKCNPKPTYIECDAEIPEGIYQMYIYYKSAIYTAGLGYTKKKESNFIPETKIEIIILFLILFILSSSKKHYRKQKNQPNHTRQ